MHNDILLQFVLELVGSGFARLAVLMLSFKPYSLKVLDQILQEGPRYFSSETALCLPRHLPSCLPGVMHVTKTPRPSSFVLYSASDQKLEVGMVCAIVVIGYIHKLCSINGHMMKVLFVWMYSAPEQESQLCSF